MSLPSSPRPLLQRLGWLAGLPVLGLLWAGATSVTGPYIADPLRAGAAAIARDTGRGEPEPWLRIEAGGRDLVALGEAPDAAARGAALARLTDLPGLRRVIDRTGLIEAVSPFVWTLTRAAPERVEAGGSRPAEIGAKALAARLTPLLPPAAILTDGARAARGAPPDFLGAALWLAQRLHGLGPGAVATLTDTELSVAGEAADPASYEAARDALAGPPQGYSLGKVEITPAIVADFRFAVERRPNGGVALSGYAVSEGARAEIRAAAASLAEGAPVEDTMRIARGLPASTDPGALARFAMRLAALLHDGAVRYEGAGLSVSGNALDAQAVGEAEALMRDERPAGVSGGPVTLTARPVSPYVVRVRREAERVVLSGHLPDGAAREALLGVLRPRFFREAIQDRTRLSSGAPQGLAAALKAAIEPLSTLASGEVAVSNQTIRISGESLYAESARRLNDTLPRATPPGWQTSVAVTVRGAEPAADAQTCARLFSERTAGRTLRFAPGSSELRPEFYPVLDAVAELARTCRTERVEVVGHLDPPGSPPPKVQPLPEARAAEDKARAEKAKAAAKNAEPKKADKKKDVGKAEKADAAAEPTPEPEPDLPRARALAILDYLQKAGVAPDRTLDVTGAAPLSDRQGVGLRLRS